MKGEYKSQKKTQELEFWGLVGMIYVKSFCMGVSIMDYYKLAKDNLDKIEKMLEGRIINNECPYCKKEQQVMIITTEKAVCMVCKNEFPIKIRLHFD